MKSALHPWTAPKGPHQEAPPKESGVQYILDRKMVAIKNKMKKDITKEFGKIHWEEERRRDSLFLYFTLKHDWVRHWVMFDPTAGIKVAIGLRRGRQNIVTGSAAGYSEDLRQMLIEDLKERRTELKDFYLGIVDDLSNKENS